MSAAMNPFQDFLRANREKAYRVAKENSPVNESGVVLITGDDPWRDEDEWDVVDREKAASE